MESAWDSKTSPAKVVNRVGNAPRVGAAAGGAPFRGKSFTAWATPRALGHAVAGRARCLLASARGVAHAAKSADADRVPDTPLIVP
jgi:hypothetical protein